MAGENGTEGSPHETGAEGSLKDTGAGGGVATLWGTSARRWIVGSAADLSVLAGLGVPSLPSLVGRIGRPRSGDTRASSR